MNNFPVLYTALTVLFAGISLCALLQFLYMYFVLRRGETLFAVVSGCAVFMYILSDICGIIFTYARPDSGRAEFFILFRETAVIFFIIILQAYISRIPEQSEVTTRVNSILFWAAIAAFPLFFAAGIYNPGLLIKEASVNGDIFFKMHVQSRDMGPLFIFRNCMLVIYSVYSLVIILSYGLSKHYIYPVRQTMAGMIIMTFFLSYYLYLVIFAPSGTGKHIQVPTFTMGLVCCVIFIAWGRIKILADDAAEMKAARDDLEHIIYNDPSLNIPGRIAFQRDLENELNRITAYDDTIFMVFLDIDDFKTLNECYGESTGDTILKMLSDRLMVLFPDAGVLYRIGGDEFAFLLKDARSAEEAGEFGRKILTCLRNPFTVSGITCLITASAGVLQVPRDGDDIETILSNAYRVIGSAKKIKNTVVEFSGELLESRSRKLHIVNILRNSIVKDRFLLFYQPVVDADKKMVHAESLLRYTGDDQSIGSPETYLPVLEDAGLMKEVDNMVIQKAFRDMEMKIRNRFSISINLSTVQLVNPAYGEFLSRFAEQHGIEKHLITLEVTEDRLMENLAAGRENITRLKKNGFRIAIDDFGKGFSSLTYLAEFPVDMLKLDMVFTQSVPGDRRKEAMVRHIIELAHSLDLEVVAEGFEKQEQFEFFKNLGCDFFQGYYFARPMPLDELLAKYL